MRTHIKNTLIALICLFIFAGVLTLASCQDTTEPINYGNQPTLPVEQNFEPADNLQQSQARKEWKDTYGDIPPACDEKCDTYAREFIALTHLKE